MKLCFILPLPKNEVKLQTSYGIYVIKVTINDSFVE